MAGDGTGKSVVVGAQPAMVSGDPVGPPPLEGVPVRPQMDPRAMQVRPRHSVTLPRERMDDVVTVLTRVGGGRSVDAVFSQWVLDRIDAELGR